MHKYYPHFNTYNLAELFFRVFYNFEVQQFFVTAKNSRILTCFLMYLLIFFKIKSSFGISNQEWNILYISTFLESELRVQFLSQWLKIMVQFDKISVIFKVKVPVLKLLCSTDQSYHHLFSRRNLATFENKSLKR